MRCELLPVVMMLRVVRNWTMFVNDGDGLVRSSIEVKPQPSSSTLSPSAPWTNGQSDPNGMIYNHQLDQKWLEGLGKFPGKHCQLGPHSLYPFALTASGPDADSLFSKGTRSKGGQRARVELWYHLPPRPGGEVLRGLRHGSHVPPTQIVCPGPFQTKRYLPNITPI